MAERLPDRRSTPLEQHIVTLLVILIASGIGWIGLSIVDMKAQIAGLTDKYALRAELQELRLELQRLKESK